MDGLKERIEKMSEERREVLRRLAPDEFARLFASHAAAANDVEAKLLQIWSEVLAVPVAREQNYFELGGDSVLSVAIVAKSRACGLPITPRLLFTNPTVQQLAAALAHEKAVSASPSSSSGPERMSALLTPLQQGMIFHSLHDAGSAAYITQLSGTLPGTWDRTKVEQAWSTLTQRHVVLRASLDMSDPMKPQLRAHADVQPILSYRTLEGATAQERQESFERFLAEDIANEFDLHTAPLMRLTFLESASGECRCVWTHHHLILDGWSQQLLLQEFHGLYGGLNPPAMASSFFDYADWLAAQDNAAGERFWGNYLSAATPTSWPAAGAGNSQDTAAQQSIVRTAVGADELVRCTQRMQVTPAVVIEAAWSLVLSEVLQSSNVTFGMTATVRPAELAGSEQVIGLCINTLPLRIAIADEGTVSEWLKSLQVAMHEWLHNAGAPLSSVLRWGHATTRLFDTLLVFENLPRMNSSAASVQNVRATVRENYAMVLVVTPGREYSAELKYQPGAISGEQALQALELFECALHALFEAGEMPAVRAKVAEKARALARAQHQNRLTRDRQRLLGARRVRVSSGGGVS